ncbi:uncharacterized protein [Primulina eburnea]|uniref:uncharacterized protein n=1 Tax=Primulina eburnea TaxID=1245227 RepID=UPI003C6C4374
MIKTQPSTKKKEKSNGGGDGEDDESSPPPTKKKPESKETNNGNILKWHHRQRLRLNQAYGKQGANKNGSAKQAPPKNCDDPSYGDDFEMARPPKTPSAKGKDAKSTAPPPTNRKQIPEEFDDGDVAQAPESDDPEMDLPPMVA